MTIIDRIIGSRPKSISIFRFIFMLYIFRDFNDSEVRFSKKLFYHRFFVVEKIEFKPV